MSNFEKRVQLNKIIESQLPEFLVADFPKAVDFFKQYYISQEYQGGNIDLVDNLDRYIKVDNLVPEVVVGSTILSSDIDTSATTITVESTKGFPDDYGLLKINAEIITYTGKTDTSFTGCIRGFSGVTGYNKNISDNINFSNKETLLFSETEASAHKTNDTVTNLSVIFLQEFYKKLKATFTPGFEDLKFVDDLNVGNFIKNARNFYQAKGIEESVKILFKILYGANAEVIDLEQRLIKPSSAEYIRREIFVVKNLPFLNEKTGFYEYGDPFKLKGQTIFKNDDTDVSASISEVEIFTRNSETFYKLGVFVGNNDRQHIRGLFSVPGASRVIEDVNPNDSIITVDSTIGFGHTGTLITNTESINFITSTSNPVTIVDSNTVITYTSKSINQFYGCVGEGGDIGIGSTIKLGQLIRSNESVLGYEDGDITKEVHLRVTGVLSEFEPLEDIPLMEDEEEIGVRNLGEIIPNPEGDQTFKEVFANSWIYNTSTRYIAESVNGSTFSLGFNSVVNEASLKVGDFVEIVAGTIGIGTVAYPSTSSGSFATVSSIDFANKTVTLTNTSGFVPDPTRSYSIRRKIIKASSSGADLLHGNNTQVSNILNVYTDNDGTHGYVASNSLPGYEIVENIVEEVNIETSPGSSLSDFDSFYKAYNLIEFSNPVLFEDGDKIVYTSDYPYSGLESGETYYITVVSERKIKVYISREVLASGEHVRVGPNAVAGTHTFTLDRHSNRKIADNKILRKFPLAPSDNDINSDKRIDGSIGILIDGVEIVSPNSQNKVYYGPLTSFEVLNGGKDYDVISLPEISISAGVGGFDAKVQPYVKGSVKDVYVDPQDFDVKSVSSVSLTGGNGSGCTLEPVVGSRFREIKFDSRRLDLGGGIDINAETITFTQNHNLTTGDVIIYNQNGNDQLGIGVAGDLTNTQNGTLQSGDEYVVGFINTTTIQLYKTKADAPEIDQNFNVTRLGINTVGLTEATTASGIHKFRTQFRNNLRYVKVLDPGSGYSNRKLRVKASGISTSYDTVSFKNHGFETGEIVNYETTGTVIAGLSTANQYSIVKVSDDTFSLINVGIGRSITTDLTKFKITKLNSQGTGYQIFKDPEIKVEASYVGSGTFTFTPIVTGPIHDAYLYESGAGYGSTIFNVHRKPIISLSRGKNAQVNPIIVNGRIEDIQILNKGSGYTSVPNISIDDPSGGVGALLRPVVENGRIEDIVILNPGIGYTPNSTSIFVDPRGFGAIFDTRVRGLTIDDAFRFGKISLDNPNNQIFANLSNNNENEYLNYGIYGYSEDLADSLESLNGSHSPIIGWAYDGNPIYGPFAYTDGDTAGSAIKRVQSGYEIDTNSVVDRPQFEAGFFIEDYVYNGSGDLDEHNGRFCKTPEFPNGTYAYFASVKNVQSTNDFIPEYPYFVGNTFKSNFINENKILDQTFDFNSSGLVRNTFPYNVNEPSIEYDFFNESYETLEQPGVVEAVTSGSVSDIKVISGGIGYKIGDRVNFDSDGLDVSEVRGEVSELTGVDITSLNTTLENYPNSVFVWDNQEQVSAYYRNGGYDILNENTVLVSGLSTSIARLEGSKKVKINSESISLASTMTSYNAGQGPLTETIYISKKFKNVSIGNSISIVSSDGEEIVRVLNDYGNGILKIKRFSTGPGAAHSMGSTLNLPGDRITLPVFTDKFKSERNDIVYFNALKQVAIGTAQGASISLDAIERPDGTFISADVPTRTIYLPNHPFKGGQKVRFHAPSFATPITVSAEAGSTNFFLPDPTAGESEVYIINKGPDHIGLATQLSDITASDGVFFKLAGSDHHEFLLESQKKQVIGNVSRIVTRVGTSATHGLQNGDSIKLTVNPNTVVGLGTTAALNIKINHHDHKIIVNPLGIATAGINTITNTLSYANHGFKNGDKVFLEANNVSPGLAVSSYYTIKVSDNEFKLAETLYDTNPNTRNEVNIIDTGVGTHTVGLINPQINVIKNGDLKFILNDESLRGYELKIYRDREFINEYVTSSDSREFNVSNIGGEVGLGTTGNASLTIKYSENIPSELFYTFKKGSYISTSDTDIVNYSKINYIASEYNGNHKVYGIAGVTSTAFEISPFRYPSVLNYDLSQCDVLSYNTQSKTALNGSIAKIKIISEGFNFDTLPKLESITSDDGTNANIQGVSTSIGRIRTLRLRDVGYDYPSDKTLRPEASVPPIVSIDNLDVFKEANIKTAGSKYLNSPNVLLWNETRKAIVDSNSLIAKAPFGAIAEIEQIAPIFGLESEPHKIICVDNSNGVGIVSMLSGPSGIATCILETPTLGFNISPFAIGDKVFVEGIEQAVPGIGTGFNSADYDYRFFEVIDYANTSPAVLTFEILDDNGVGLTTNAGIAKTYQNGYATIINSNNYPQIDAIQERGVFEKNERLYVSEPTAFGKIPKWEKRDLSIALVRDDYVKVGGRYKLKKNDLVKGFISGVIAKVISVDTKRARFKVDYSSKLNIGWNDDIGKLSEDYQATPDNDYYQNLSYSVKSPITWEQQNSPVNSLIHPAGLKNFADVGIQSTGSGTATLIGSTSAVVILDVVGERRVDIINNFDNAIDDNPRSNPINSNLQQSNTLKIQNRKLNDYIECRTNQVLIHDDISNKFSSRGFKDRFVEIDVIDFLDNHVRYLVQIQDPDTGDIQLSELLYQSTPLDLFLFEKHTAFSNIKLGNFEVDTDGSGRRSLRFVPTDPFDRDHDIKILKKTYLYQSLALGKSDIETKSFGSINLTGSFIAGITSVGTASSIKTFKEFNTSDFNGAFANIEISDLFGNTNVVEAILDFDGTDTHLSEYYFDTNDISYSASQTGIITATYDSTTGIVSFRAVNSGINSENSLTVRANIIGFGSTSAGIGTYRFLLNNQPAGTERSGIFESTVGYGTDVIRVGTFDFDLNSSATSVVRVSVGETSAIHQVYTLANFSDKEVTVIPGPFSQVNETVGLGTFGSEISGNDFFLNFYPDIQYYDGQDLTAQAFNEVFYREMDFDNQALPLEYGPTNHELYLSAFDGINGLRANRVNFPLTYQGNPIYNKSFDPSDTTKIDYVTGIFTYPNHFFNTGEELNYIPRSTFTGIGQTGMGIGATANYAGIVTTVLPEKVYAIAITPDTFQLSSKKEYTSLGIAVTFTSAGSGNAHELEFTKKLSKTVIGIDGIVQQPITFSPINYTLENNDHYFSGGIPVGINTFNISGISSLQPRDILRIDDEYMKIETVGFSSNINGEIVGPITGVIQSGIGATFNTVSVVRGFVGSAATSHLNQANVQLYKGSFNIVKNDIFFTDPPKGNTRARRDEQNLPYVKAEFSGRTFLRQNYDENMIFDDNSNEFTGIGRTYTLKVGGADTTGISPGNGILFINGVFQTPSTENNTGNNYDVIRDISAGISSVVYTGITSVDGTKIQSEFDINQNQIPRGGLVVSYGSTPGLGYAPLYGPSVLVDKNGSGEITNIVGVNTHRNAVSISTASYDKISGLLRIETSSDHNLNYDHRVKLDGLEFSCDSAHAGVTTTIFPDYDYALDVYNIISDTELTVNVGPSTITHLYENSGTIARYYDLSIGSGYRSPVSIAVTDLSGAGSGATVEAIVGAGGTLAFNITDPGTGYIEPVLNIPEPNYENMEVIGVSRLGVGSTTETGKNLLLNLTVGAAGGVGIGSTLFDIESFKVIRSGYGFKSGDVMEVVGLVTAKGLAQPISNFQLEVRETFTDTFSSWSFGEMDFIDNIGGYQNGTRKRFPLFYKGELLSFELDPTAPLSQNIDLDSVLLIFVNGVLQTPGYSYQFTGGTSFIFTEPPQSKDKIDIFFYIGEENVDSVSIEVTSTIKVGDDVFVRKHPNYSTLAQETSRTISDIPGADILQTEIYTGNGIDENNFRPIDWIKQKSDIFVRGNIVTKARDVYEPKIFPTAKIIGDVLPTDTEIFVDNAQFFTYDNRILDVNKTSAFDFDAFFTDNKELTSAEFTNTVSAAGTVSSITITTVGAGYTGSTIDVKFSAPKSIGVGVGTTATATATITNGQVSAVTITNPGFGYTTTNPPFTIIESPKVLTEEITTVLNVQGFSGIITGISTCPGINGHPLALKFNFTALQDYAILGGNFNVAADTNDLQVGYPVMIYDTVVGQGVTSVDDNNNSVVGIGSTFLDNIYKVHSKTGLLEDGEIICNIHTDSPVTGIAITGAWDPSQSGICTNLGRISFGRIYNFDTRNNGIAIGVTGLTVDAGLSSFPSIQRRGDFGEQKSGAVRSKKPPESGVSLELDNYLPFYAQ